MNPVVIDMLTTQYVWVIQNESSWHTKVTAAYLNNSPNQFERICWDHVARVCRTNGESLTFDWTAWVVGELRRQFLENQIREYTPSHFLKYLKADIDSHMAKAEAILNSVQEDLSNAIFETKETNTMTTIAFATKHFIFGQDTANMTEEQLIDAIKKIEAEIANLNTVKTKSAKIAAKIKELNDMLASVVGVLDAK